MKAPSASTSPKRRTAISERQNLHGKNAPPFTIECDGKTYAIPAALDVGDLLGIEKTLYQRAIDSLAMQRIAMDPDRYNHKLDELRDKYDRGDFGFENEETQVLMKTPKGALLFLNHVLKVSDTELVRLFQQKGPELFAIMQSVTKATFPDTLNTAQAAGGADSPKV